MPIHSGKDKQGSFYQWGKTGKKYYYVSSNEESRKRAYKKAQAQQTAIYSSGYKGDSEMKKPTMKLVNVIVKRKDSKPAKKASKDIKKVAKKDGNEQAVLNAMKKLVKSIESVKKDWRAAKEAAMKVGVLDKSSDTYYDIYNELADIGYNEDMLPESMADILAREMKIREWFG